MTAAVALIRGRALAESLMVDAGILERQTGETTDPVTGVVTPTFTTVYSGKARIQTRAVLGTTPDAAGHAFAVSVFEVQLPISAPEARISDRWTTTASSLDAELVGVALRVRSLFHKTHATSRRLTCEEIQA